MNATELHEVMELAADAYMADAYGELAMRRIARFLLEQGHSPEEAAAIMLSKHLRWADDCEDSASSVAFKRYYARAAEGLDDQDWLKEGALLASETF